MNIELIAQNAIRITTKDDKVLYFDPFQLNDKYQKDADIIFITHSHYDHFSQGDIDIIKNDQTKIVITEDLFEKALQCGFEKAKNYTCIQYKQGIP